MTVKTANCLSDKAAEGSLGRGLLSATEEMPVEPTPAPQRAEQPNDQKTSADDKATMPSPVADSDWLDRVAVVVVHGVAEQEPGSTLGDVFSLLVSSSSNGTYTRAQSRAPSSVGNVGSVAIAPIAGVNAQTRF